MRRGGIIYLEDHLGRAVADPEALFLHGQSDLVAPGV